MSIEVDSSNREAQAIAIRELSSAEVVPSRRRVNGDGGSFLSEEEENVSLNAHRRAGTHVP